MLTLLHCYRYHLAYWRLRHFRLGISFYPSAPALHIWYVADGKLQYYNGESDRMYFVWENLQYCWRQLYIHVQLTCYYSVGLLIFIPLLVVSFSLLSTSQMGAADAEIKVPYGENTELKRSPFKAWSRSVYSHTFYAYCQGFLPFLFLPFRSIHLLFFFSKTCPDFSCVGCG